MLIITIIVGTKTFSHCTLCIVQPLNTLLKFDENSPAYSDKHSITQTQMKGRQAAEYKFTNLFIFLTYLITKGLDSFLQCYTYIHKINVEQ